jgi:hypothetical protein
MCCYVICVVSVLDVEAVNGWQGPDTMGMGTMIHLIPWEQTIYSLPQLQPLSTEGAEEDYLLEMRGESTDGTAQ